MARWSAGLAETVLVQCLAVSLSVAGERVAEREWGMMGPW